MKIYLPTNGLTWVGARDAYASKKLLTPILIWVLVQVQLVLVVVILKGVISVWECEWCRPNSGGAGLQGA